MPEAKTEPKERLTPTPVGIHRRANHCQRRCGKHEKGACRIGSLQHKNGRPRHFAPTQRRLYHRRRQSHRIRRAGGKFIPNAITSRNAAQAGRIPFVWAGKPRTLHRPKHARIEKPGTEPSNYPISRDALFQHVFCETRCQCFSNACAFRYSLGDIPVFSRKHLPK